MAQQRHQFPLAAHRPEFCVRHVRGRVHFSAKSGLRGPLVRRGADRARRGVHQLQRHEPNPSRNAAAAPSAEPSSSESRQDVRPVSPLREPVLVSEIAASAESSPAISRNLPEQLAVIQAPVGFRQLVEIQGQVLICRIRNHRTVAQGMPRSRHTAVIFRIPFPPRPHRLRDRISCFSSGGRRQPCRRNEISPSRARTPGVSFKPLASSAPKTTSPSLRSGSQSARRTRRSGPVLAGSAPVRPAMNCSAFRRPMPVSRRRSWGLPAATFRNGAASSFSAKQTSATRAGPGCPGGVAGWRSFDARQPLLPNLVEQHRRLHVAQAILRDLAVACPRPAGRSRPCR